EQNGRNRIEAGEQRSEDADRIARAADEIAEGAAADRGENHRRNPFAHGHQQVRPDAVGGEKHPEAFEDRDRRGQQEMVDAARQGRPIPSAQNDDENAELYQMGGETRWFLHAPSLTSPRSIIVLRISSCSSS